MNPEYKKEFDIPDHEDFQVAEKYYSQKSFAVKEWKLYLQQTILLVLL